MALKDIVKIPLLGGTGTVVNTTRPLPIKSPQAPPLNTTTGTLNGLPILIPLPVGTMQNLGQAYEIQTYNEDGQLVTKKVSYSQLQNLTSSFDPNNALNNLDQASEAILLDSAQFDAADIQSIIQDSVKVDYLLGIKSQPSIPVDFNTLQTPELSSELVYNFYIPEETDSNSQEDQSSDPFLSNETPPRYVQLSWDAATPAQSSPDFVSRTKEESALVKNYLSLPRGVAGVSNTSIANSYKSNASKTKPLLRDGQQIKIVDTHDMERGFNSTSNSRLFKNAALAIININKIDENTIQFSDLFLEDT